jgi:hypothetical protein
MTARGVHQGKQQAFRGALSDASIVAVLLLAGLLFRASAAWLAADVTPGVEIWEYGEQGYCAARTDGDLCFLDRNGEPYASALMPPLVSYVWLALFELFGLGAAALTAYVAVNVVVGSLAAPLLYAFSRGLGLERGAALAAGALIAVYPTFVYVSATYHATNFTVVLLLAFGVMLLRAFKSLAWNDALFAGLFAGLSVLTRNELLVVAAGAVPMVVWAGRRRMSAALAAAAVFGFGVGAVMGPWVIRNAVQFERFVPVGTQSGYNLWIAFGPHASGSGNQLDNDPSARAAAQAVRDSVETGDRPGDRYEDRIQRAFAAEAMRAMEQGGVARIATLTAEKFVLITLFDWTDPITHSPIYWGPWLIAFVLAGVGIVALIQRRHPPLDPHGVAFVLLSVGIMVLAYSISGVFARYRMHIEPFEFVFAGVGAWVLARHMMHTGMGAARQAPPA